MPYTMRYLPNNKYRCWSVRKQKTKKGAKGKKIFARCTTKAKAKKQLRLLRALQNNPKFRAKSRRRRIKGGGGERGQRQIPLQLQRISSLSKPARQQVNSVTALGITGNRQQVANAQELSSMFHNNVNGRVTPRDLEAATRNIGVSREGPQSWLSPVDENAPPVTDANVYAELHAELNSVDI